LSYGPSLLHKAAVYPKTRPPGRKPVRLTGTERNSVCRLQRQAPPAPNPQVVFRRR